MEVARRVPVLAPARPAAAVAIANVILFTFLSVTKWAAWGGLERAVAQPLGPWSTAREVLAIVVLNLAFGLLVVWTSFRSAAPARGWRRRLATVVTVSLVWSAPRALLLHAAHTTPTSPVFVTAEWLEGAAAGVVCVVTGQLTGLLVERARAEAHRRLDRERAAARAVADLQDEETRVRRLVSNELHGTVQHHLVAVTAGLDRLAARVGQGKAASEEELADLARAVEAIREEDVRGLSHAVFPAAADIGAAEAIAVMLARLPSSISASIELGPGYQALASRTGSPVPVPERLIAIYTVEEAVTNALKHGQATTVRVLADVLPCGDRATWLLDVTVDDDGSGLASGTPVVCGLTRHRDRIEARGGMLELLPAEAGGARLHFTLPFTTEP